MMISKKRYSDITSRTSQLAVVVHAIAGLTAPHAVLAVPIYSSQGSVNNDMSVAVTYVGAMPEDSVQPYRWYWTYEDRFPIEFEFVSGSDNITDGSDRDGIARALGTWNDVPDASITSSLDSFDGDWGAVNGDNELAWIESGWSMIGGFDFPSDAIAVAVTWHNSSTMIQVESDIFFNGQNFSWYTDTDDAGWESQFVEHIALHELGHAFSLNDLYDVADADRTMYGYSTPRAEDITLNLGDMDALSYAYAVPEPATLWLLTLGSLVTARRHRRRICR